MIRTVRRWTALLLTLAMTFALLPAGVRAADSTGAALFSKGRTLRILALGNSFSVDGFHYLYQMAESAGYDVVIGNLYASACSLSTHWKNAEQDLGAYTYYKISDETDGAWGSAREVSIAQALQDEQWDVVTLQQASAVSGVSDSYYETISWSCDTGSAGGGTGLASADGGDAVLHSLSAAPAGEEPVQSEGCEPEEPEPEGAEAEGEESTSLPPEGAETAPPASPEVQEAEPSDMPWKKTQQSISCGAATSGDTLTFALNAAAKTDLTYRSSDTAVAQVDGDGTVTLTGSGTATVTITAAESDQYASATRKVTVTSQLTSYMERLADSIRAQYQTRWGSSAARRLKLGWQMTWAYAEVGVDSDFNDEYQRYYGGNQDIMYQAVADTARTRVASSGLFSFYVPTGTAVQNARTSYAGDRLNRDGVHLSYGVGRYIAAMTWAAALGIGMGEITYRPGGSYGVSALDLNMIRDSISAALETPWMVTPSDHDTAPVLEPAELKSVVNTGDGLRLTWTPVEDATGYRIYRRSDGDWSRVKTLTSGSAATYTDTAVKSKSGTVYTYCVKAYSGELIAAASSNRIKHTRLVAPTSVSVKNTSTGIRVAWNKVAGATSYRVYRERSDGTRSRIATVDSDVLNYTDTAVKSKNGSSYTYQVVACSKLGNSVSSAGKKLIRLTGVTLKSLKKYGSALKLTWTRNSRATGYYVYRKTGSGSWSKIKTISKNSTLSYTDKAVKRGKTYTYRIYAYKSTSTRVSSNAKSIRR